MKRNFVVGIILIIVASILAIGSWYYSEYQNFSSAGTETLPPPVAEGIVNGHVLLGPTCPVERIPPDPNCAPRPYQTSIDISKNIETPTPMVTIMSDASGTFSVSLPAGEYDFHPRQGTYPRCNEMLVDVVAGVTTSTIIDCDTGIR